MSIKLQWLKTQTMVSWYGMDAAEITINYVLLTDNEKAGDWKEYK